MSNLDVITNDEIKEALAKYGESKNGAFDKAYLKELEDKYKGILIGVSVCNDKLNFVLYHKKSENSDCYSTSTISIGDFRNKKNGPSTTALKLAGEAYNMVAARSKLKSLDDKSLKDLEIGDLEKRAIRSMPTTSEVLMQWGPVKKLINQYI